MNATFWLECGHSTDRRVQQFSEDHKPSRGLWWCEYHTRWVKAAPKAKRKKLPDEPMF